MDGPDGGETPASSTPANLPTKRHYQTLDGLRGVAALVVVIFHTCEVYSQGDHARQIVNHGYLAVDFFFLLSGFVVAYAYDDRWGQMRLWDFLKRRLIRLQPMVVMGTLIGAALFYVPAGPTFPLIATTPLWQLLLAMLVGFTLVPLLPSMDVRGWGEMHPLDGPAWSLFYEYAANLLYALGVRKLSVRALGVLVLLCAGLLVHLAVTSPQGDVIGGWSVDRQQLHIGFARVLAPFFLGLLLMRAGPRIHVKGAFAVCSLLLVAALAMPRVGGPTLWLNGLYESFCILVVFPIIVMIGAGDRVAGPSATPLCRLLGDLSYPLYMTHYPLVYIYTAWVVRDNVPAGRGAIVGAALFLTSITVAYACLKLYDEPVRRWLNRRLLGRTA